MDERIESQISILNILELENILSNIKIREKLELYWSMYMYTHWRLAGFEKF